MQKTTKLDWIAITILAVHVVLSVVYSVVVPIWEAHDEWAHYAYVEYVARNWRLPPAGERLTDEYEYDEASQPPLYYILAALPVALVDTSDDLVPVANPYATRGTGEGGVNFAIHDPDIEGFPWQGTVLAVHLARFVSILVGTVGCLATYALGRFICPRQPWVALGALAIHAFAPQWLFINSVVSNDVLVSALGAWTLYFGVRVASGRWEIWDGVGLLLAPALGILTKYTAIGLVPFAVLALAIGLIRSPQKMLRSPAVRRGLAAALLLAVVGISLIFWRNWAQTGHLLPRFQRQIRAVSSSGLIKGLAWDNLPQLLNYGFRTFWASFGWGNVGLSNEAYWALASLCGLAVIGAILGIVRRRRKGDLLIGAVLVLCLLLVLALPLYQELHRGGRFLRGRYLLPALPVPALLLVWGIPQFLPIRARKWAAALLSVAVLASSVWVLAGLIAPAYSAPSMISRDELQSDAQQLGVRFDGKAELAAYELWPTSVQPGDGVSVSLWWRSIAPMELNYTLGVHLIDSWSNSLASRNHYPGGGNYATSIWNVGDLFQETYWLEVPDEVDTPTMGRVSVALFLDDEQQAHLHVADADGQGLGHAVYVGRLAIRAREPLLVEPETATNVVLSEPEGGTVRLMGFDGGQIEGALGRSVPLTLHYEVLKPLSRDYVVFLHLLQADGSFVLSRDGPPLGGRYPTGIWGEGEQLSDNRDLLLPTSLPIGRYQIATGMYDPQSLNRLLVHDAQGQRLADDLIPLLTIDVTASLNHSYLPQLLR